MRQGKQPADTLEEVIAEAIERERIINEQHPERHGYGMINGEADDLIWRIEKLERNQLKAQVAKVKHREDKIRVIGADKLYTHSPEEIVINKIEREKISNKEGEILNSLSKRSQSFYYLREQGLLHKEIARIFNVSRRTVGMDLQKTRNKLKEGLKTFRGV